jgi:hypothetical protein
MGVSMVIRTERRWRLVMLTLLSGPTLAADLPVKKTDEFAPFKPLVGQWECHGTFAGSGAPIGASLAITIDGKTGSLLLRHDDLPPNAYHAVELWGPAEGGGFRAVIADASSGMRWLTSPGWLDGVLQWERQEGSQPKERFRYTLVGAGRFKVEWFVIDATRRAILGDSIDCARV